MNAPLIQLSGIEFGYTPGQPLFRDLHFTLGAGQRIGLTGANGCGKSTLLHLMTGLLRPDAGAVHAFGKRCNSERDFLEVRRQAGYLLQDSEDQLFCPTVLEDLMFGPLNFGAAPAVARERALQTLDLLGLTGYEHRVTYKLSGGEKRMVALAAVLAMEPRVLLLDEPTAGLDAETEARLAAILERLDQEIVLISHNRKFLDRITNTVYLLDNSRLVDTA
ncbi:MAG: ABC transporter ATP-binding protein [Candidatus Hydrogenedentes bacterium]|nr:ABC transporter ATP-binding protein [Candidatus Hydrogenedentota bacterium]